MRQMLKVIVAGLAVVAASPALAGHVSQCFRPETIPAQYQTIAERVMVQPARTVAEHIPAEYKTVHETVMVRPASSHWGWKHVNGQSIYCQIHTPAEYRTVARTVMVSPARVFHRHVPAVFETVHRHVIVSPQRVVMRPVSVHGVHCGH